jgi:hypothetical protein
MAALLLFAVLVAYLGKRLLKVFERLKSEVALARVAFVVLVGDARRS